MKLTIKYEGNKDNKEVYITSLDKKVYCPICGKPLKKKSNALGEYYGCTGYRKGCQFIFNSRAIDLAFIGLRLLTMFGVINEDSDIQSDFYVEDECIFLTFDVGGKLYHFNQDMLQYGSI